MNVLVFEDSLVDNLYPVTTGRPAYAITCGSFRLLDWLVQLGKPLSGWVRPHLKTLQSLDFPELNQGLSASNRWTLLVNARLVPSRANFLQLQKLLAREARGAIRSDHSLAAAVVPTEQLRSHDGDVAKALEAVGPIEAVATTPAIELPLLNFPHEIIRWNVDCFVDNLRHRIDSGHYREVAKDVFVGDGATLGEFTVTDTKAGPIVLDRNSQIGPYCFLRGPAYLGCGARVIEQAALNESVSQKGRAHD